MNPYKTPDQPSDVEEGSDGGLFAEPADHPHYALVVKMVLWDEPSEEVFRRLAVNGVTGGVAEHLYQIATAERIRTLRAGHKHKLLFGVVLILAAVVTFSFFWFGLRFIPKILLSGCFAALGVGSWKFIDGLSGYLMAPSQKGSVADHA